LQNKMWKISSEVRHNHIISIDYCYAAVADSICTL